MPFTLSSHNHILTPRISRRRFLALTALGFVTAGCTTLERQHRRHIEQTACA